MVQKAYPRRGPEGSAEEVATGIRRIVAPNPGPMTGDGTNSYIVGVGAVAVIDPGPEDIAHRAAILAALKPGERVAAILVTHPHLDHSAGAPALSRQTGAPILGFGPAGAGLSPTMARLAATGLAGGEGSDHAFRPDRLLSDGDRLAVGDQVIGVLHVPGHMASHLAFAWGRVLFSGDLVMGWASTFVSPPEGDMAAYMASLARLQKTRWDLLLPGHGPVVTNPRLRLAELVAHRRGREAEILAHLAAGPATPADLTRRIYLGTPATLMPAAERNVLAHLIDLWTRTMVTAEPDMASDALFRLHDEQADS